MGRRAASVAACALGAFVFATAAAATPNVGFADDATKYSDDGGAQLFGKLQALGAVENRVAVYWDPNAPDTIQEKDFLDRMLSVAAERGVRIVFSVYPKSPFAFSAGLEARAAAFANYLKLLARTYPQVKNYAVLNEPNEAYFWAPQHDSNGDIVSAQGAFRVLAAGYDALKSVDPAIRVAGLGISPAANDKNSTSPVRFIDALGRAYRASGRTAPIMDELDLHIYPDNAARQDDETHYAWPQIGPGDLDRAKQAIWDAFSGTGQPVFQEPGLPGPFMKMRIGEIGWQVEPAPSVRAAYTSAENVAVTDEARQAKIYGSVVRTIGCDPSVEAVDFFHLVDDRDLVHYQSGLLRVDGTPRASYDAVRDAIKAPCTRPKPWRHATAVLGASALLDTGGTPVSAGDLKLTLAAGEDVNVTVAILRAPGRVSPGQADRAIAGGVRGLTVVGTGKTFIKGGGRIPVSFSGGLSPGTYVVAVRMTAVMNAGRSTTAVSSPFTVRGT